MTVVDEQIREPRGQRLLQTRAQGVERCLGLFRSGSLIQMGLKRNPARERPWCRDGECNLFAAPIVENTKRSLSVSAETYGGNMALGCRRCGGYIIHELPDDYYQTKRWRCINCGWSREGMVVHPCRPVSVSKRESYQRRE